MILKNYEEEEQANTGDESSTKLSVQQDETKATKVHIVEAKQEDQPDAKDEKDAEDAEDAKDVKESKEPQDLENHDHWTCRFCRRSIDMSGKESIDVLNDYFKYNFQEPGVHRFHQKDKKVLRIINPEICPNVSSQVFVSSHKKPNVVSL